MATFLPGYDCCWQIDRDVIANGQLKRQLDGRIAVPLIKNAHAGLCCTAAGGRRRAPATGKRQRQPHADESPQRSVRQKHATGVGSGGAQDQRSMQQPEAGLGGKGWQRRPPGRPAAPLRKAAPASAAKWGRGRPPAAKAATVPIPEAAAPPVLQSGAQQQQPRRRQPRKQAAQGAAAQPAAAAVLPQGASPATDTAAPQSEEPAADPAAGRRSSRPRKAVNYATDTEGEEEAGVSAQPADAAARRPRKRPAAASGCYSNALGSPAVPSRRPAAGAGSVGIDAVYALNGQGATTAELRAALGPIRHCYWLHDRPDPQSHPLPRQV